MIESEFLAAISSDKSHHIPRPTSQQSMHTKAHATESTSKIPPDLYVYHIGKTNDIEMGSSSSSSAAAIQPTKPPRRRIVRNVISGGGGDYDESIKKETELQDEEQQNIMLEKQSADNLPSVSLLPSSQPSTPSVPSTIITQTVAPLPPLQSPDTIEVDESMMSIQETPSTSFSDGGGKDDGSHVKKIELSTVMGHDIDVSF